MHQRQRRNAAWVLEIEVVLANLIGELPVLAVVAAAARGTTRIRDAAELRAIWSSLDAGDRAMPELALRAAQRMLALGGDQAVLREWLRPVWGEMLAHPESLAPAQRVRMARARATRPPR